MLRFDSVDLVWETRMCKQNNSRRLFLIDVRMASSSKVTKVLVEKCLCLVILKNTKYRLRQNNIKSEYQLHFWHRRKHDLLLYMYLQRRGNGNKSGERTRKLKRTMLAERFPNMIQLSCTFKCFQVSISFSRKFHCETPLTSVCCKNNIDQNNKTKHHRIIQKLNVLLSFCI